jgi:hypothetical protein
MAGDPRGPHAGGRRPRDSLEVFAGESAIAGPPALHGAIALRRGAEGATAPESLRPKGPQARNTHLESDARTRCVASADGVTLSGESTDGALAAG